MFNYMWRYGRQPARAVRDAGRCRDEHEVDRPRASARQIDRRRAPRRGRTLLTELESKEVLAAYGIPIVETRVAATPTRRWRRPRRSATRSCQAAQPDDHAQDRRRRRAAQPADADAVREAFEEPRGGVQRRRAEHFEGVTVQPMINYDRLRADRRQQPIDPQFGPVLLFGMGGTAGRGLFRDRALALPPLNTTLARRMIERTKILRRAARASAGRDPSTSAALEQLLVRFSQLVVEQPWIAEIDINPLLASASGNRRARCPGRARLSRMNNPQDAEFALLVSDKFQGQGLGSVLLEKLLDYARDEGIRRVMAYMLPENRPMRKIATGLGFSFEREDDLLKAEIEL
jgi:acetyltransferase